MMTIDLLKLYIMQLLFHQVIVKYTYLLNDDVINYFIKNLIKLICLISLLPCSIVRNVKFFLLIEGLIDRRVVDFLLFDH